VQNRLPAGGAEWHIWSLGSNPLIRVWFEDPAPSLPLR